MRTTSLVHIHIPGWCCCNLYLLIYFLVQIVNSFDIVLYCKIYLDRLLCEIDTHHIDGIHLQDVQEISIQIYPSCTYLLWARFLTRNHAKNATALLKILLNLLLLFCNRYVNNQIKFKITLDLKILTSR